MTADLRVLTLWQPYASLWADPDLPKSIETRGKAWPSTIPLPAWLLICAAARKPTEAFIGDYRCTDLFRVGASACHAYVLETHRMGMVTALPLGAVIGAAHVTDCLPIIEHERSGRWLVAADGELWSQTLARVWVGPQPWDYHLEGDADDITADLPYGIYTPGRYGYATDRTVLFPEPIPWRGSQTWQRATPELVERVTPYLTEGEA